MYSGCPLPYMPSHGLPYPPTPANFYPLIGYTPSDSLHAASGPLSGAFSGPVPSAYSQANLGLTRHMPFPPAVYHPGHSHNSLPMFPYTQFKEEASPSPRLPPPIPNVMPQSPSFIAQDSEKLSNSAKKPSSISSKSKKKSVQLENKKRRDFSELARARTEKLMTDGLNFNKNDNNSEAANVTPQQTNLPTTGSEGENQQDTIRNNIIEDALSQVKLHLMRSDEVISLLQAKQQAIEHKKMSSELFSVKLTQSKS